jgi:hypothetical protein
MATASAAVFRWLKLLCMTKTYYSTVSPASCGQIKKNRLAAARRDGDHFENLQMPSRSFLLERRATFTTSPVCGAWMNMSLPRYIPV